jgi:sulfotransferase
MNAIHFISGTPRSGSTLLSALLRQNPALYANMTSPVLAITNGLYTSLGAHQEWAPLISDEQRSDVMRAAIDAYYARIGAGRVVFDTNRGWCAKVPTIAALYPQARIIACVREFSWVIDSFERLFTHSPLTMSKLFNLDNGMTAYARADTLGGLYGVVGFAWHAVREAIFGEFANRIILIDYEALTREPGRTMEYLYRALNLPPFQHDFDNVEFDAADEFDAQFGLPGMHRVRRKVEFVPRRTILPPDLFDRFRGSDYWKDAAFAQLGIQMCVWSRG